MFDRDSSLIWEQYKFLISESKQSIINLGYPKIIVDLLYEKFGKNSFIISKWLKESLSHKYQEGDTDWWSSASREFSLQRNHKDLFSLIKLYYATRSEEQYLKEREDQEDPVAEDYKSQLDLREKRTYYTNAIREKLFDSGIFYSSLVKGIANGAVKNLKEYSNLNYRDAVNKYNQKNVFEEKTPLKVYENGSKWIDVGAKCELVGSLMKNCGSTGVMSSDPDRTIITLFDSSNVPHVLVTYSPNQKRISGAEGQAGSKVKEKYYDYILDLEDHLNAHIDYLKVSEKILALKAMLKGNYKQITTVYEDSFGSGYYLVIMNDGQNFYTNFYNFIPYENIESNQSQTSELVKELRDAFNSAHIGGYKDRYISRYDFLKKYNITDFEYKD